MKNIILLLLLSGLFGGAAWVSAQQRVITGKVTGAEDGKPIEGVVIMLKDHSAGTFTNEAGAYEIKVPDTSAVILYSFVTMATQEIRVGKQTEINVVLKMEAMEEVVLIGYGSQKKKDLTTAVVSIDQRAIENRPMVSAIEALQGRATGVQVVSASGKPGGDISVRVRGATSVLAGNEPLYVVDGVPTTDIRGLNPGDIATMTVLKDASSAAIYGARAANGVVLITTRRGSAEKTIVTLNMYSGISRLRKPIEVLNTKQYWELMEEVGYVRDPLKTRFSNWSDTIFGTGINQAYQLSYSGGSDKTRYLVSGGYLNNKGIIKPAQFDRYSLRLNLDNDVTNWLKIGTSVNMLHMKTKDTPDNASSGRGGVIMSALNTPPFLQIYEKDSTGKSTGRYDPNPFQPSWENPVAYMYGAKQLSVDYRLFGNANAEATLAEGLKLKTNFGADIFSHQWDYYLDAYRTAYGRQQNGIGRSDKSVTSTWLWENTLGYEKAVGKHSFTALGGQSLQKQRWNDTYLEGTDFPADSNVRTLNAANSITGSTNLQEWALASFFARVTYNYDNKYYLTVSTRRDGSSKLAADHRWGTMPSFSAGWRLTSEPFMKNFPAVNDLKLRGGWGKNGNQEGISNYASYGLVNYFRQTPTTPLSGPGSYQASYGNPDLRWETTTQSNIGLDIAFFNSRLMITADAYIKNTEDVLLNVQLSNSLPISTIQTNAGSIRNKGLEFNVATVNTEGDLSWRTDFNISFNRNEVTHLDYTQVYYFGRIYSNNQDVAIVREGLPLGSFFGYVSEGVNPETGDIVYKDVNGNGIFDTGDRTVIGNAQPAFIFGLSNTLAYKRFDLSIFFQGSYGNDIYNATRIDLEGMFDSKNQSVAVLDRWQASGDITDIPRVVPGGSLDNVRNSSRFVEDGSFVRLKALTLSYRILDSKTPTYGMRKVSVYATGQNLLTFTKYSGFDPEVNAFGKSATELGIDYGTYPQAITATLGVNVEF